MTCIPFLIILLTAAGLKYIQYESYSVPPLLKTSELVQKSLMWPMSTSMLWSFSLPQPKLLLLHPMNSYYFILWTLTALHCELLLLHTVNSYYTYYLIIITDFDEYSLCTTCCAKCFTHCMTSMTRHEKANILLPTLYLMNLLIQSFFQ